MPDPTPPLDLTALRERAAKEVRRMKSGEWSSGVSLSGMTLNALLDRVEAAETEASKYRGLYYEAESAHTDAEAKAAAARELHALDTHVCECGDTHGPYCKTCQYDYPCPTIRALGGVE